MYRKYFIIIVLLLLSLTLYSCGGGGKYSSSSSSSADSSYGSIQFSMPSIASKYISAGKSTVRVTLTGDGLSSASVTTYNYASTITVSNVPVGYKTAKIEILDANGNLIGERIFTLYVKPGAVTVASATIGITVTDTGFSPQIIEIPTGTTLVWVNNGSNSHKLIQSDGTNLGIMLPGQSISVTFSTANTITYFLDSISSGISGTILVTQTPVISAVNPAYGAVGDTITIIGTGFGNVQHINTVTFGNKNATVSSWSNTQIVATVPAGMTTGTVFVTVNYVSSSSSAFRLEPPVFVWKAGTYGTGNGQLKSPQGMLANSAIDRVYVCEDGSADRNDRISVFKISDGSFVTTYGSTGAGNGQFQSPAGIAQDPNSFFYVTDTINNRVQKFNSNFQFVTKWGSTGAGNGQFNQPQGIAIYSPNNLIYIVDAGNNRIQRFDPNGTFDLKWGSAGSGNGQFNYPFMIAIGGSSVYVTDFNNNRVQIFTLGGNYIDQFGSLGSGNGQFNGPAGIAIDSNGDVYVSDSSNNRVQKFNADGTFISKWGSLGTGNEQFTDLTGVAVDSGLNVYTSEGSSPSVPNRIKKYRYIQ